MLGAVASPRICSARFSHPETEQLFLTLVACLLQLPCNVHVLYLASAVVIGLSTVCSTALLSFFLSVSTADYAFRNQAV